MDLEMNARALARCEITDPDTHRNGIGATIPD